MQLPTAYLSPCHSLSLWRQTGVLILDRLQQAIVAVLAAVHHVDLPGIAVAEHKELVVQQVHLEDVKKYLGQVMDSEELFGKLEAGEL